MPRTYMRKRGARQYPTGYTEGQMDEALAKVRSGASISKAAKESGVPKSSLHDPLKGIYF